MAKKQKPASAPADDALKNVSDYRFPEATRKNRPPRSQPQATFRWSRRPSICTVRGTRRGSGSIRRAAPMNWVFPEGDNIQPRSRAAARLMTPEGVTAGRKAQPHVGDP